MRDGFAIFDTHTHIGTSRHSGRRCDAAGLLRSMDRHGVDQAVAIPFPVVDDYRAAHDEIGAAVRAYPDRLAGAACLYPFVPEPVFRDEVRRCREKYGFIALKLQPQYQALNPLSPRSAFVFETALENGLALIWHTGSGVPYALPSLLMPPARQHPGLNIVLAHCGGGIFFQEAIVAASFCPNICLELSTLTPHQAEEVAGAVPCHRLMIGSDLPENMEAEIGKILGMDLDVERKSWILAGTARHVFGVFGG